MRAPFPVEFTSTSGHAWRAARAALVATAVAVPIAWALDWGVARASFPVDADGVVPVVWEGVPAALAAALAFALCWRSRAFAARARTLRWDGQDWTLPGTGPGVPEQRGDAALMLDLGPWMLVRFRPRAGAGRAGATWLPLHAAGDRARWTALRTALWTWRGQAR